MGERRPPSGGDTTGADEAPVGVSQETWVPDAEPSAAEARRDDSLLAGRYRIGKLLGRGGSGQVFRARDMLSGRDVAVKLIRPVGPGVSRQIRREVLALRVLSLPGVIHLRDDGWLLGQRYLVMDLLEGGPFDGLAARGPWATFAAEVHALLEALARVHFLGIVHRDLKPANILLDAEGAPVLTDFGLAQGELVESFEGIREGTPRYMAPEQARGDLCDERTDLYAVGVMLAEMVGDGPVPDGVAATIAAMRAEDPSDRPASALEALRGLGADADRMLGARLAVPPGADAVALRVLFDELPKSFLHIAEDAAEVLFGRTGGAPDAVRAEVERWVRMGRCHVVDGKVRMARAAVDKLRWEDSPEAAALAEVGRDADEGGLAEALLAAADGLQQRGRNERALAVLDIGLSALEPGAPRRGALLEKLVCAAVALADEDALRLAQHRAERMGAVGLARLAEGVRAKGLGQAERAAELLSEPLDGEAELHRLAQLVLALGATSPARTATLLRDGLALCGDDPVRLARWHIWCGNAAYARGDFGEAAEHGRSALQVVPAGTVFHLTALINTAAAALERFELAEVCQLCAIAGPIAARLRYGQAEALASILRRSAAYRRGEALVADGALVAAVGAVTTRLQAQAAFLDAAIAYRLGDGVVASENAALAARGFEDSLPAAALLSRALLSAAGGQVDLTLDQVTAGSAAMPASMRLELAALLVPLGLMPPPPPDEVQRLYASWPAPLEHYRVEVFALPECVDRLGVPLTA
ncbi:MAG: serine/threonine-protein kinase [Myxococcota bacterium]